MFKPLSLAIGLRYLRAKQRSHFVSFISILSVLGIALGVGVLITVLSVMNGFDLQIKNKIFSMVPSITITTLNGKMENYDPLEKQVLQSQGVKSVVPFVGGQGLLQANGEGLPAFVTGVEPGYGSKVIELDDKMLVGSIDSLVPGKFKVVLGQEIAYRMGVTVGDKITLITPELNVSPVGVLPRIKRFTVSGIFNAGGGFGYNNSLIFINMKDAQALYKLGDAVTGLQIKLDDPFNAPMVSSGFINQFPTDILVNDWSSQYGNFFHAIQMEKNMMFLILGLIIAVAVFNLVSMLVMAVNEKNTDIAILKTYGATTGLIMRIFIIQGFMLGLVGTLLGIGGGILLSTNVTKLANLLQSLLHTQFISSDVYFLDYLPSHLMWSDVWHISLVAMGLSLLATLYPAYRGASVQPSVALRY